MKSNGRSITYATVEREVAAARRKGLKIVMKVTREYGNIYVLMKSGSEEIGSFKLTELSEGMRAKILALADSYGYA